MLLDWVSRCWTVHNYTQLYHFQVRKGISYSWNNWAGCIAKTQNCKFPIKPENLASITSVFLCLGSSCLKMRLEKFTLLILAIVTADSLGKEFSPIVCVYIWWLSQRNPVSSDLGHILLMLLALLSVKMSLVLSAAWSTVNFPTHSLTNFPFFPWDLKWKSQSNCCTKCDFC